ncbi:MAG: hypothetical protein ACXVB9_08430 [Bdellovibrionota bacterium]
MKKLLILVMLPLLVSCSTAPAPMNNEPAVKPAPKLDASVFKKIPKLTPEQIRQKERGCDKGSVQDCADLVRFNSKSALGEAFAKDTHRLCVLDGVECQLNQAPFPRKKSREKTHSGELIASWGTQYQDEDGPHSFVYKIYQ